MTEAAFDYTNFKGDPEEQVGDNLMARIQGLAQEWLDAKNLVESMEERLAEAKAAFLQISEHKLPDLLDDAQLGDSKITTPAGHLVSASEVIRGSIPEDSSVAAFQWLEDHDDGNIIKRQITIEFNKGDEVWAKKFIRDCQQRKKALNLKQKKAVHPMTLQKYVREALEEGVDIPMKTFGVYRQRFAKVKVKT